MKIKNYSEGIVYVKKAHMYQYYKRYNSKDRTDISDFYPTKEQAEQQMNSGRIGE